MTMDDFTTRFLAGVPVKCKNVAERADVLDWLEQAGYALSPPGKEASRKHSRYRYAEAWTEYMNPIYAMNHKDVTMTCNLTKSMLYEDVRELFEPCESPAFPVDDADLSLLFS